ncbi:hypothetical protein L345_13895, partial [Ophiophagus hannah]
MDPASPNTILLCTATGFYPLEIEIQWLKNGQLEEEGVSSFPPAKPTVTISPTKMDPASPNTILLCTATGFYPLEIEVMLETQPQRGDVYTCKVGHPSLEAPITVQCEPHSSSSARSKLWTGAVAAMIEVAFMVVGLFSYLKSKKEAGVENSENCQALDTATSQPTSAEVGNVIFENLWRSGTFGEKKSTFTQKKSPASHLDEVHEFLTQRDHTRNQNVDFLPHREIPRDQSERCNHCETKIRDNQ